MDKLEIGGATALVGAAVFSVHSQYTSHAGPLSEARKAAPGNVETRLRVLDADVLTGGLVLLVGGTLAATTGNFAPLILASAGFLLISGYYHATLNASPLAAPAVEKAYAEGNEE